MARFQRYMAIALSMIFILLTTAVAMASGAKVSEADLKAVHAAFQQAKKVNFTPEAMIKLYSTPGVADVASAVKKLVDLNQSRPELCITPGDSAAMETTRQAMNMLVLQDLAAITGGSIEVMNAGKQNGIRSDKDLMLFAVLDGKRPISATELKKLYETCWLKRYGTPLQKMDMTIFDGDAMIPNWRDTRMSLSEYVEQFKKGQAKLEQNPEAVREAGTWRQGAELRYATGSRVTLVKAIDPDNPRLSGKIDPSQIRVVTDELGNKTYFAVVEEAPVAEASTRYANWSADLPYRNAMDAAFEWQQRHDRTSDFIDKMKYFNRTVGDGINALAMDGWEVQYIFHLAQLPTVQERVAFIKRMVDQVYVTDLSAQSREHYVKVISLAAEIEVDKMMGRTRSEAEYLRPIMEVVAKDLKKNIDQPEVLEAARQRFFGWQKDIMRYNLMAAARQKLQLDIGDTRRAALLTRKYARPEQGHDGWEEVKKLRWETWRQIGRIIDQCSDDVLIARIVQDAPKSMQARLQMLHEVARFNRELEKRIKPIALAESDPPKAREQGPQEKVLSEKAIADLQEKESRLQNLLDRVGKQWDDFKVEVRAGSYSDEAITAHIRQRVLDTLGYQERTVFNRMEVEYEMKFSGSKLLSNLVCMGNAVSVLNVLQVYQQTGDWNAVVQTAVWEIISNVPGVSQLAALKQAFNDGNVEGLAWVFIAYQVPAAGQVKIVFDIAKGTVTLLYNHAMDPLKDDRFSQIYTGYVDAQPAGWSPFKPGFKERRQAASDSILHFVPGDTLEQKRSNMYKYFHDKLDAILQAAGHKPETEEYWQRYDRAKDAFFRKYVHDYFAAQGDWSDNLTVGLKAIGQQEELQQRLVNQLVRDFEQGSRNYEKMEEAREKMTQALEKMNQVAQRNLEAERRLLALRDSLSDAAARDLVQAMPKLQPVQAASTDLVRVSAFPPTVTEGQQATLLVQSISQADPQSADALPQVEVSRVDGPAPSANRLTADQFLRQLEDDLPFALGLIEAQNKQKAYRLTKIEYEVVVKRPSGQVIGKQRVSVNLAGSDMPAGDENITVKLCHWQEMPPQEQPKSTGLMQNAKAYKAVMMDYQPSRVTPFNTSELAGWPNFGGYQLLLWVTWKQAPPGKTYIARLRTSGGIPAYDKTTIAIVRSYEGFDPAAVQHREGNCFILSPYFPVGTVGTMNIQGELRAYDPAGHGPKDYENLTPVAVMPIEAACKVPHPTVTATGKATLYNNTSLSGSVTLENLQQGVRPAQVSVDGRSAWTMLRADFSKGAVSLHDLRGITKADQATIRFMNWGRMESVTVNLETKYPSKPPQPPDSKFVEERMRLLERYMKEEQTQLDSIASMHGQLAYAWERDGNCYRDYIAWKKHRQNMLDYIDKAIAAAGNPASAFSKRFGGTPEIRAKQGQNFIQQISDRNVMDLRHMIDIAAYTDDIGSVRTWLERIEKSIPAMPQDRQSEGMSALENGYRVLATILFRQSGDLVDAKAQWDRANDLLLKRYPESKPIPLPWQVDPTFNRSE